MVLRGTPLKTTLPETNSLPLKIGHPKEEIHLPIIAFQGIFASFKDRNECPLKNQWELEDVYTVFPIEIIGFLRGGW